jgi:GxxExxY protein
MRTIFDLCDFVRETAYAIHQFHGHGHLEKVYENALAHRLQKAGIKVEQQHPIKVYDEDGTVIGNYLADLFVEDQLIIELKAVKNVADEHVAQILGYLKSSRIEHGLLINFGSYRFYIKKYALTPSSPSELPRRKFFSLLFALLAFFCGQFILPLAAAEPIMNHETALTTYVEKLNTHTWAQIAPYVTNDAVFIFTEGTFIGHAAAKAAFEKTFALIENEIFSLHNIVWTAVTEDVAACHYVFRWKGLISGQESSGGGRGTSILRRIDGRWLIVHEHLGPYPRKA